MASNILLFLQELVATPMQREILVVGLLPALVIFSLDLYMRHFRSRLQIAQLVNVRNDETEQVMTCEIVRLPDEGSAIVMDLRERRMRSIPRSQIYSR